VWTVFDSKNFTLADLGQFSPQWWDGCLLTVCSQRSPTYQLLELDAKMITDQYKKFQTVRDCVYPMVRSFSLSCGDAAESKTLAALESLIIECRGEISDLVGGELCHPVVEFLGSRNKIFNSLLKEELKNYPDLADDDGSMVKLSFHLFLLLRLFTFHFIVIVTSHRNQKGSKRFVAMCSNCCRVFSQAPQCQ